MMVLTIGNFTSKLLVFLMVPFYTMFLTTDEYGTSDLIITTVNLISPIFTLQIGESVMRFSLDEENDKREILTIGLLTVMIGFVLIILMSKVLFKEVNFSEYYNLFLLYYLFVSLNYVLSQFIKGIENIKLYTINGIVNTFAIVIFNIFFLMVMNMGIKGYMLSMVLANVVSCLILYFGANINKYIIRFKYINKNTIKNMISYSIPLIPNSISWWISNSSDRYILAFFNGISATGIYSVSYKIPTILSIISSIFIGAWQISAVEDFGSEASKNFYSKIYKYYSSMNIIITTILIMFIKFISNILFAKEFYRAWIFSPILILGYMFYAMAGFLGTIYTSAKDTKMVFLSTMFGSIFNIVLNLCLVPYYGGVGAASATFISYLVIWIFRLIDSRRIIKIDIDRKKDISCYLLLLIQVILVCSDKRIFANLQIIISIIILWMQKSYLTIFIKNITNIIKNKVSKVINT